MQEPSQLHPQYAHILPDTARLSDAGVLHIAGHPLPALAQRYGTPLYLYDRTTIIGTCQRYRKAFSEIYTASPVEITYAAKAYLAPELARLLMRQGLGLDVVSGGELLVAHRAGFPLERLSFHGNNKSEEELRLALDLGVGRVVLDNWSELERLTRLARVSQRQPAVLLRVAPAVETETHRYLQTGHAAAKFGFPLVTGEAKEAALRILAEGQLRLVGLHAHVGTMLRETRPYEETLERLLALAEDLNRERGWWPEVISPGGGWGIATPDSEEMPAVETLAAALERTVRRLLKSERLPMPALLIEPGRSIIARAGIALYRVGVRKSTAAGVTYLFVDGGMGDNIRPALYGARYTALAVEQVLAPPVETVCVAGRYCESGDILIEAVELPRMQEGALLAVPLAGAYCLPLASNYNLVPRPSVLLLSAGAVTLMERRETYQDLLARYVDLLQEVR